MGDIYDQHDKAFSRVSAFVVAKDGEKVATIAFKLPADGAGRLYAYVHWLGEPMVRGFASGYGYDKRSAACAAAAAKLTAPEPKPFHDGTLRDMTEVALAQVEAERWRAFRNALIEDGGEYWNNRLEAAGFTVWQAV